MGLVVINFILNVIVAIVFFKLGAGMERKLQRKTREEIQEFLALDKMLGELEKRQQ